ncbi:MAG TPA: hypothetical protein VFY31_03415 [Macromonas sp.]|nr:hypothetical protein [Macromonas sp.]
MKTISWIRCGVVLAVMGVSLAACSNMGASRVESAQELRPQFIGEIPLPQDSQLDNDKTVILGGGAGWAGQIVVKATQGPTEVFIFFRDQLPLKGWVGVSSVKSRNSIMVFAKQERTLTVEVREAGGLSAGSVAVITVAPKGGFGGGTAAAAPTGALVKP